MDALNHLSALQLLDMSGRGLFLLFIVSSVSYFAYSTVRSWIDPDYEAPCGETRAERSRRRAKGHRYGWIDEEAMSDEEWGDWQGQRSW